VAKFQGDRSRDLGERVAKKKITSRVKHKPVRNYRSGQPNKSSNSFSAAGCISFIVKLTGFHQIHQHPRHVYYGIAEAETSVSLSVCLSIRQILLLNQNEHS